MIKVNQNTLAFSPDTFRLNFLLNIDGISQVTDYISSGSIIQYPNLYIETIKWITILAPGMFLFGL